MAERHRRRDDVEFADETVVSVMVGVQSEREYPAETGVRAGELAGGECVMRVRFEPRIFQTIWSQTIWGCFFYEALCCLMRSGSVTKPRLMSHALNGEMNVLSTPAKSG